MSKELLSTLTVPSAAAHVMIPYLGHGISEMLNKAKEVGSEKLL